MMVRNEFLFENRKEPLGFRGPIGDLPSVIKIPVRPVGFTGIFLWRKGIRTNVRFKTRFQKNILGSHGKNKAIDRTNSHFSGRVGEAENFRIAKCLGQKWDTRAQISD